MSEARDEHGPADGNGVEAYPFPHPLGSGIRYCARCLCGWTATPYNTERSAIDALNDHIEDGYRDIERWQMDDEGDFFKGCFFALLGTWGMIVGVCLLVILLT